MTQNTCIAVTKPICSLDIANFTHFEAAIKRHALLFETIVVPFLLRDLDGHFQYNTHSGTESLKMQFSSSEFNWVFANLEWMIENQILGDADDLILDLCNTTKPYPDDGTICMGVVNIFKQKIVENEALWISRFLACLVRKVFNVNATPIVKSITSFAREVPPGTIVGCMDGHSVDRDGLSIIIKQMPIPEKDTPWEQIMEFRSDPNSQYWLLRLRNWVRKTVLPNGPPSDLEEELEWLLSQYTKHYRLHRMQYHLDVFHQLVKGPIEVIENLVKIKWSKVIDPFFEIGKRRLKFLKDELLLPGADVAYIAKVQHEFKRTGDNE